MKAIKKRKVYSAEYKAKIGLEALRGEKTINEIGHDLLRGASESSVRTHSGGQIRAYDAELELIKRSVDSMLVLSSLFLANWLYGIDVAI